MDYIYDIVLNFQNNYYDFYEWKKTDKIINLKKISVYLVSNADYLNLKYNEVIIDKKTFQKSINMFLVTNGIEVMGILLDNNYQVIKRSSLLFDEADEVIEDKDHLKTLSIKYKKNIKKEPHFISRILNEKIDFLENFFLSINKTTDEYLLKYIYYDIYQKEEPNVSKVYKTLKDLINTDLDKLYNAIQKVNLELKNN